MQFTEARDYCKYNFQSNLAKVLTNDNWDSIWDLLNSASQPQKVWSGVTNSNFACQNEISRCKFHWSDGTPFVYNSNINGKIIVNFNNNPAPDTSARLQGGVLSDAISTNKYKPLCQMCQGTGKLIMNAIL